jgi:hypothetical protein
MDNRSIERGGTKNRRLATRWTRPPGDEVKKIDKLRIELTCANPQCKRKFGYCDIQLSGAKTVRYCSTTCANTNQKHRL